MPFLGAESADEVQLLGTAARTADRESWRVGWWFIAINQRMAGSIKVMCTVPLAFPAWMSRKQLDRTAAYYSDGLLVQIFVVHPWPDPDVGMGEAWPPNIWKLPVAAQVNGCPCEPVQLEPEEMVPQGPRLRIFCGSKRLGDAMESPWAMTMNP